MKRIITYILMLIIGVWFQSCSIIEKNNSEIIKTGEKSAVIIDYSPPSSKEYIGSPSIVIMPDGKYIASHDYFGKGSTNNTTNIFRSSDKGKTWTKLAELEGQWWSTLFVHNKILYIIGTTREYGDVVIRHSDDGGVSWTKPEDEKSGILLYQGEYHCSSVPVLVHNGRIWRAMEERNPKKGWGDTFQSFVMSASIDSNLLLAESWISSNKLKYEKKWPGGGWLEGNVVASPEGQVVNILRNHTDDGGKAAMVMVSDDGKELSFNHEKGFIDFPGGCKKFTIRYDSVSNMYWALTNFVPERHRNEIEEQTRNTLTLISSNDLLNWKINSYVLYHSNVKKVGFQYCDWQFDGNDMIFVSRTAYYDTVFGGAPNNHDANYFTFHRLENFRESNKKDPGVTNFTISISDRIAFFTKKMTLEEKITLLGGKDGMATQAIPRLRIPSLNMANGPNGVGDKPGTCFPASVAMAATWNEKLINDVGIVIGKEARAKNCDILLGPCVNIHRTPLGGRNFESYSEDPFLAGRMGVNFIDGVQSQRVATSLKHYALNNQESSRGSYSAEVDERALREIYLSPFEMIVKETQPMTVMAAYNKFRGEHCTQSRYLLNDVLRDEWGFEGFIVSDWDATHSTIPVANAGMDLEMPGKPKYFNENLLKAVKEGKVSEKEIDNKVSRILNIYFKIGIFDDPKTLPEGELDTDRHRSLAAQTAREAIVLLKNEKSILPLDKKKMKSIAVIGPNAAVTRLGGGGSSEVIPFYSVSPLDGIKEKLGDNVKIIYNEGAEITQTDFPVIPPEYLTQSGAKKGTAGLKAEFFNNRIMSGDPVVTRIDENIDFNWGQSAPDPKIDPDKFSARWTGVLTAPKSGRIRIGTNSNDGSYLYIDGLLVVNNWGLHGPKLKSAEIVVEKGKQYDIMVEYYEGGNNASIKLEWQLEKPELKYNTEAVEIAQKADVAIIFAGLTPEWEGEGFDRENMDLPGAQDELIKAISRVNENTIVILNSGAPVTMTKWINSVPAIVEAWYLGQETGNAVADVLFGDYNPSGKLPVTFPEKYEDNPSFPYYLKDKNKAEFGEGIYVGYRYYDSKNVEPLFPFGYGLSYTNYEYSNLKLNQKDDDLVEVSLSIKNTGKYAGSEVAQLFVHDIKANIDRPEKELKGFEKIYLKPGESKSVTMKLDTRAFSFYDVQSNMWVAEKGEFEILIGASSKDIRLKSRFELK